MRRQTNQDNRISKTAWVLLAIGSIAFLFSSGRWNIFLTAWIWPAAFLYFSRSSGSVRGFLPLAAVIAVGNAVRWLNVLDAGGVIDAVISMLWSVCWILPFVADRLLYRRLPGWASTLLLPGVFVSLEFLRHFTLVGSYGVTAYTQTGILPLVQSVSLIGSFGLSFLILWFGPVLLHVFEKKRRGWGVAAVYGGVLLAVLAFGFIRLNTAREAAETVRVAGIVGPYYRKFSDATYESISYEESAAYLLSEAERAAADGAEIACWNEEAFSIPDTREVDFLETAAEIAREHRMILILAYEAEDTDGSEDGLTVNKLVILQPDGSAADYIKTHLVPVIEAPYYVKGTGAVPTVRTDRGVISAVICFDDSYISFNHGFGAELSADFPETDILFVPSWDWHSVAAAHTKSAEFRAVENGYALVKPTYDGLSAAVDRYGRELMLVSTDESGFDTVRCVDIPLGGKQTFYGRHGTVLDLFFAGIGLVLVCAGVFFPVRRKEDGRD